ncbi:MAG: GTPase Era [bacterium]
MSGEEFRSGYAAIVGRPNVGKSTLLNALLKQKLAITTPKPQTTRHRIMGILTHEAFQIVLLDTPGLFTPGCTLQSMMVRTALETMRGADVVLVLIEATEENDHFEPSIIAEFRTLNQPVLLVINKIDLVTKERILPLIAECKAIFPFAEFVPISALYSDGLDDLLRTIVSYLPKGELLYSEDMLTDQSERFFVSELIREVVFNRFKEEVPYSATVKVVEFKKRKKLYIRADIFVERDSQKAILIGEGGAALKEVGQLARKQIEAFLEEPVFLDLWVKVRRRWRNRQDDVKELEYSL